MTDEDELRTIERALKGTKAPHTRVALLRRAVDLADARGSRDDGWRLRLQLIDALYDAPDDEQQLLHFAWCIAQHDADPTRFSFDALSWSYKWIVTHAASSPHIAARRVLALVDDMARRFVALGKGERAVAQHRALVAGALGDLDSSRHWLGEWERAPRDALSDCAACDPSRRARLYGALGDDEAHIELALGVIRSGARCAPVPGSTHAYLLAPLRRRGESRLALEHHLLGYRLVQNEPSEVGAHGEHLAIAAHAGLYDEAIAMIERHLPHALTGAPDSGTLSFFVALAFALSELSDAGIRELPIRLPERLVSRDVTDLGAWAREEAATLMRAFDERNGNTTVSEGCARHWPAL